MNGFSLAGLVFVFFPSFILGCFVLIKSRNRVSQIWAAFLFSVALWGFGMFKIGTATNIVDSLFWWRVAEVGVILIPVLLTHFVIRFLGLKRKWLLIIFYLVTAFFLFCDIFTNCFINELYFAFNQFYYILETTQYTIFIGIFVATVIYVLFELGRAYKKSTGIVRSQIKYLFWAFAIGFSGGLTSYFPVYKTNIYPVWNATIFISVVMVTYATIRYRLMDIRVVLRSIFIYFWDAVFVFLFYSGIIVVYPLIWGSVYSLYSLLSGIVVAPLFVLSLFVFNYLITAFANKYVFHSLYDYQQTIAKLSSELSNYSDLGKIVDLIVDTIKNTMGLNRAGVLLIDKSSGTVNYKIAKVTGFDVTNGISLVQDNFLTKQLKQTAKPLVREELVLLARDAKNKKESQSFLNLEKAMAHIEASLCLPLLFGSELRGIIVLGAKNSGDPYSKEDLSLLTTLSNQAAIAIDNARLYQEAKNFNKVLQKKVDEQTKELRQRAEHLQKLLEMRSEFLDIASHQLKTPVSVIKGTISMFRDGSMDKLPEAEKKKFFDNIYHKAEKLNVIIGDILRASEVDTEEFKIDPLTAQPVQLEDILKSIYEDLHELAESRELKLNLVLAPKKLAPIMTNADFLEQALYNLVDNAIKYTSKGSVTISLKPDGDYLMVQVADTGIGIPEADRSKIFDKFSRAKNAVDMYADGSGLGLFIVKRIVEAHDGGSVVFDSKEGQGTTFTVKIKAAGKPVKKAK